MTIPAHRTRRRWRINWSALLGVLLLVAAAYIVTSQYRAGEESQRRADCQAQVNAVFLNAISQRDEANKELNDAQRVLITAPSRDQDPKARDAANKRYLAALAGQAQSRAANPLPQVTPC